MHKVDYFTKIGLPSEEQNSTPTSNMRFPDNSHFRIEIPTVNSFSAAKELIRKTKELKIRINRVTETYGIFRHTKEEILDYVTICADNNIELVMSPGPRAIYDTSATVNTIQGRTISYRLRGLNQLIRAIEDIKRGIDLGVKSFLIYDEGMLWVVSKMRNDGELDKEIKFKISAHCGHGNPASIKLLEQLGANSINPVRDLDLSMISTIRCTINIPLDIHIDNPPSSGGFIRTYEAPEIVRIASPVNLKTGNSCVAQHGQKITEEMAVNMAEQAYIVLEFIKKYNPEAIQSNN